MTHFPVWSFPVTWVMGGFMAFCTMRASRKLFGYDMMAEWKKGKQRWTLKTSLMTLTWLYFTAFSTLSMLVTMIVLEIFTGDGAEAVGHIAELSFNIAASSHTSTIFLIVAYVALKVRSHFTAPMLNEREIKHSVIYSIISLILYPTWQMIVLISGAGINSLFFVVAPQFFYSIELTLSAMLLIRLSYKLGKQLENTAAMSRGAAAHVRTIQKGLLFVIAGAFMEGWAFLIINCYMVSNVEMHVVWQSICVATTIFAMPAILLGSLIVANAGPISAWWTAVYNQASAKGAASLFVIDRPFLDKYSDAVSNSV